MTALHNDHEALNGVPPQATWVPRSTFCGYSVPVRLLPYIEQGTIYAGVDCNDGYASQPRFAARRFRCIHVQAIPKTPHAWMTALEGLSIRTIAALKG